MRPRSPNPKRNAVAVRFDDEEIAEVDEAASREGALTSPWVRDAAVEKARRLAKANKPEEGSST